MYSLLNLLITLIDIVFWLVIASAILSWLVAFNVVNLRNSTMATIYDALERVTAPLLSPIRRFLPTFGGLDLSPVALLLLLTFLRNLIHEYGFGLMR